MHANLSLHFLREVPHDVMDADASVEGPRRLEVFLHARLERIRHTPRSEEVLQVARLRVVVGATRVHALDDGSDVSEHDSVHQSCKKSYTVQARTFTVLLKAEQQNFASISWPKSFLHVYILL